MECKYSDIEKKFSDYILRLIGPSEERNQIRESKFKTMKSIFERAFKDQGLIAHVFSFGSYPIRTYLPESDMDITVILEDSTNNQIIPMTNLDYQNKIFNVIQYALESHNNEVGFLQITEINHIPAEVKLIKCKFDNLAFDISVNNFVGLCKLSFMSQLERKLKDNLLYKKSLFLIKCWSYYEATILGSNVGLMASYALEVLIIYMFNNFSGMFTNEIEAVLTFFQLMSKIDWNKKIITIFGLLEIDSYYEKLKNNQYNLNLLMQELFVKGHCINANSNNEINFEIYDIITQFIKIEDLITMNKNFEKVNDKSYVKKVIDTKLVNIIDPLLQTNNLGKSVNFHNFSKITKVFEYSAEEASKLLKQRQEGSISSHDYFNSLCQFFSKTITYNNTEIFHKSLPFPKILINYNGDFTEDEISETEISSNTNTLLSKEMIDRILTLNTENLLSNNFQTSEEVFNVEKFLLTANPFMNNN